MSVSINESFKQVTAQPVSLSISLIKGVSFLTGLAIVLWIYNAIPGLSLPTMGQVVWTSGFAQSFSNSGWPAIYAHNFGYPMPMPIAFGLSGAFLQSTFIALGGFSPASAYALMTCSYLTLAFWGAFQLARFFKLSFSSALLMAMLWLITPMIWIHAAYSMLSLGMALLPSYLWITLLIYRLDIKNKLLFYGYRIGFLGMCIIAAFMDGYTYVMWVCGALILFIATLFQHRSAKSIKQLMMHSLTWLLFGIIISYQLYTLYVGQTNFEPSPMSFFRGWGVDLTMLAIPTQNVYWLWDWLGLSVPRSLIHYYGDDSVWLTSFSILFIVLGMIGAWMARRRPYVYALLAIALFGTYMSLGPSLKINSLRPQALIDAGNLDGRMLPEHAIMSTGNSLLSQHLPGFKNMRASYRWLALGMVGFWGLFILLVTELEQKQQRKLAFLLMLITLLSHFPNFTTFAGRYLPPNQFLANFNIFHHDLTVPLQRLIAPHQLVLFVPHGHVDESENNYVANYLAATTPFSTYNVGGGKNLEIAKKKWPREVQNLFSADVTILDYYIKLVLLEKKADHIIIPHFDLYYGAFMWPPTESELKTAQDKFAPVIHSLSSDPTFNVIAKKNFTLIALNPSSNDNLATKLADLKQQQQIILGETVAINKQNPKAIFPLSAGWHSIEPTQVWSMAEATLNLYVGDQCQQGDCILQLYFGLLQGPDKSTAQNTVNFYLASSGEQPALAINTEQPEYTVDLPIKVQDISAQNEVTVTIKVPSAKSPFSLGMSQDERNLGISLRSMRLLKS